MILKKEYTKGGNVKIVDQNGFSICNMTSTVAKENEANADYIISLNEQRNELLQVLEDLRNAVFSENDIRILSECQRAKEIINSIKNARP